MRARNRPAAVRGSVLNLAAALWLLALLNEPFWVSLWQATGGWDAEHAAYLLTLPVFALAWVWLTLELLTWGRAAKPVLCTILVLSAAVAYFMHRYGIAFDRGMLTNVMETDVAEARELLSPSLAFWIVGFGVLPALAVAWWPRLPRGLVATVTDKVIVVSAIVFVAGMILVFQTAAYTSLFRNHRDLRLQLVPTNYLSAAHGYVKARLKPSQRLEVVSTGATRTESAAQSRRPMVFVMVVGETMRAANLPWNGYDRPTAPLLSKRASLVNFGKAASCGTATAVSLPCMFLDVGRQGYDDGLAYRRESLLDVLQAAGLDVWWLSNNSGCKGVCDRVQVIDVPAAAAKDCGEGGCTDEVLVEALKARLANVERDTVIVMHMKGQHGPAYYLRYPTEFEAFGPVCRDNALNRCSVEQVVNAYDNAVRYSDFILDQTIRELEARSDRLDTAMVFVSDHGESLGEKGLFLHGMPYEFAPQVQKEVPFVAWLPAATRVRLQLDVACLSRRKDTLSHDNLYHSMLGLTGTRAGTYRENLDVFAGCRASDVNSATRSAKGPI
ncbi:phosphoethanolamine transferase [Pseudorhodoferax aquiterrae]|uniref:Phosphoethanolamine transferase n=1 Tax=Pseudorhodoferax aquiterrae TaxID=747304 RepID=A0ABQ3G7Y1_9BURK|nr:phosphoethanolamine--lipid A transferase [Pseudorhodoferax aquiterrae]GHC92896.1 phosphoethanolamine transferase [Pseudorhodoferax aquiterrae]